MVVIGGYWLSLVGIGGYRWVWLSLVDIGGYRWVLVVISGHWWLSVGFGCH